MSLKLQKQDKIALLSSILFGIVNFAYAIFNHCIAPDSIAANAIHYADSWEFSLGRWGLRILDTLRFGITSPYLVIPIALMFLTISTVILVKFLNLKHTSSVIILSAIIMFAPHFTESSTFIYCFDSYCLAFLLSCLAATFLQKKSASAKFIGILCTIFTASIYQAYLGVIFGLIIINAILKLTKTTQNKTIILDLIRQILFILLGIILYYLITKGLLAILHINLASYKGANASPITILQALPKSISTAYHDVYRFLLGKDLHGFYYRQFPIAIYFLIGFAYLLKIVRSNKLPKNFVFIFLLLAIIPPFICIMDLIAPTTSLYYVTSAPIITLFLLPLVAYDIALPKSNIVIKLTFLISAFIIAWTFFLSNLNTFIAREDMFQIFKTKSESIIHDVTTKIPDAETKKWCFNNVIKNTVPKSILDRSNKFIANDTYVFTNFYGVGDTAKFIKRYLHYDIETCTKAEYEKIISSKEYSSMQIYPDDNSIRIINGIIMIKLDKKDF